jgi:hypothetical protein
MDFDAQIDQLKADIRSERFFDSLAPKPQPFKYIPLGFDWGVCLFWTVIIGGYWLTA